jgi:hypothetical protein
MKKYIFSIKTRDGLSIKRLMISGRDQEDADRKLNQMYRHCEIISCGSSHQEIIKTRHKNFMENFKSLLANKESISG